MSKVDLDDFVREVEKRVVAEQQEVAMGNRLHDAEIAINHLGDRASVEELRERQTESVETLLRSIYEGKKINAIKEIRSLTGLGLKDAKDMVERFPMVAPAVAAV